MRRIIKAIIVSLVKRGIVKPLPTVTYSVEMQVYLDENKILHRFVAEIEATSKRAAKWEAKQRCRIKVGVAAKKTHLVRNGLKP